MPEGPGTTLSLPEVPGADRCVRLPPADPIFGPPLPDGGLGRLGPYRVLKRLGAGGMGAVYLGHDDGLDRRVALKVLLPEGAADPAGRSRFLLEARAAAAVKHDHVVTIYQVGEDNGIPFIAMEFLSGTPLDQYVARKGQLTVPQALRVGWETAEGLAAAHALGLVHRDIKPANIWLEAPRGRIKILDFGIARRLADDPRSSLTGTGTVVGTPGYMSPEQARGKSLDARTDLFSLGVVLYQLTTGRMPFDGDTPMAVLTALAVDDPPPVRSINPEVPPPFEAAIHRLLAKNPDERPTSTEQVAADLRALAGSGLHLAPVVYVPVTVTTPEAEAADPFGGLGTGTTVQQQTERTRPGRSAGRGWGVWTAAGVVLLLATCLAAGTAYSLRSPPPPKDSSPDPAPPPAPKPAPKTNTPPAADPGRGLLFAPGQYVEVPGFFLPVDGPFTLEGYVTPGETAAVLGHVFGTQGQCRVVVAGREPARWEGHVANGGTATLIERSGVAPGRRTHVALVRNQTELRLYLDGRLAEARPSRGPLPPRDSFAIGGEAFTGAVDEVRVSGTARYDKPFAPPPRLLPDRYTLALYKFDEGEGDVLRDGSGNERHGRVVRARWSVAPDRPTSPPLLVRPGGGVITHEEFDTWLPRYLAGAALPDEQVALIRDVRGIVSISQHPITEVGFERLTELPWVEDLRELHVSAPSLTDAGLARVGKLKNLEVLIIRGSKVTDVGLQNLASLPKLDVLVLSRCQLTDGAARHLATLRNLVHLDVSNTGFGDEGLKGLAPLARLAELRLDGTAVTDAGLGHLSGRGLKFVSLTKTKTTPAGLKGLLATLAPDAVVVADPR